MRRALQTIYREDFGGGDIEPELFRAVFGPLSSAIDDAFPEIPERDEAFVDALRHSAEVFSAFKVHRAQSDMARRLLDSNGDLKPFEQWSREVMPIASHQFGPWLRTEYDTAVIRAQNAADWRRFEQYRDVLPNLRWVPSTSVNPGADHLPYWGTVLPIDHPFWSRHHPGDRWNCKCSLEATDDEPTGVPENPDAKPLQPQPGLRGNPGKSGNLFDQSHPYFPDSCSECPFNSGFKNRVTTLFNKQKDCCDCSKVSHAIPAPDSSGFLRKNSYANGGELLIHRDVEKGKPDYHSIVNIAQHFARAGEKVQIPPRVHYKSETYCRIYGSLMGTIYERKCPDLKVGDKFYEFESFVRPWRKKKIGRMLSHGLQQSPNIIIDNTSGCSDRFLKKRVIDFVRAGENIDEVWVYEKGKVRMIYKKSGRG